MTPTQRSLAKLRKDGWTCAIVEKWNPHVKIRQDLFGIFDLLCLRGDETMGVQVTSGSHVAERVQKIADAENTPIVREANWSLMVHGWRKNSAGKWICREVDVS